MSISNVEAHIVPDTKFALVLRFAFVCRFFQVPLHLKCVDPCLLVHASASAASLIAAANSGDNAGKGDVFNFRIIDI